ncbi:MAG: T9SS type A sorting domain-containing protein [Bacteroidota bacterium]
MIPNPLRDRAELRIRSTVPGTVHITISDVLGQVVRRLPLTTIQRAGEYAMPLDVSGLLNGSYIVQVENGESRGSTQMVIMK